MIWNKIHSSADAKELVEIFGGFHDACIKEAHLWTKHFVNRDLSMSCNSELDTNIKIVIQRQFKNPSCIELLFEEVTRFNLVPTEKNYNSVIYEASIVIEDEDIYWLIDTDGTPADLVPGEDTWIRSKQLRWRAADELLGSDMVYGNI